MSATGRPSRQRDGTDGAVVAAGEYLAKPSRPLLPRTQVLHLARQNLEYFVYVPDSIARQSPVFVAVHGLSRNAEEHARLLSPYCETHGALMVAPLFHEMEFSDYQRLGRVGRGRRADSTLDSILAEVERLTGCATGRIHLFGFSGGAQFAHRYAMAHPHQVAHAVLAASGWYTFPDRRTRYPYGTRAVRDLPGVRFDPEEFLRVPMTVIVGEKDTTGENLRSSKRVIRQQGEGRIDRARNWVAAMTAAAKAYRLEPRVTLEIIPGGDHLFAGLVGSGGLGKRTFAAMFGPQAAAHGHG